MAINPNKTSKILITGTSEADSIKNYGYQVTISTGNGNDTVHNDYYDYKLSPSSVSIDTGEGNDYVKNYIGRYVTVTTGTGNDYVYNDSGSYCTINTGSGNDSVYNYHDWNSTINTGVGNDFISLSTELVLGQSSKTMIQYNVGDGNDTICGFDDNDTLSIDGSYSTQKTFKDVIITVGEGKIFLIGAASLSALNIKGTKSSNSTSSTIKTVTNKTKSPVTVGSVIKTVNASSRTKAVKITGNSLANTITGGSGKDTIYGGKGNDSILGGAGNDRLYGQKGNDTLWGGAGNDSLWGGSGNDTFIYKAGEGTDKIFDYQSGDMLKILKSNGASGGNFTKSNFSNGTLSLTISGGGNVIFNNVTASTEFNINSTTYTISGSKLVSNS